MAKKRKKRKTKRRPADGLNVQSLWQASRAGSHAGRGFHFQDAVATELALEELVAGTLREIIPEGLEDISIECSSGRSHIQVKSRRKARGLFRLADLKGVWRHLAERLVVDPDSSCLLLLERGIEELPELTGTSGQNAQRLAGDHESVSRTLLPQVADDLAGMEIGAREFLNRLSLEVREAVSEKGLRLLSAHLGLPAATCHSHYSILRGELAAMADENGQKPHDQPASMGRAEMQKLLEQVSEAVDPSALNEAIRSGTCELVDFLTPLDEKRFYQGVDALPGHVVAGLALERPDLSTALLDATAERGAALAVGPSGSGKSALVWLAAWESRQHVTWYRVMRLNLDDVPVLVRFARGARPTERTPIGFVVDDVGRQGRDGWDELVAELRAVPHVRLIGACREEDVLLVRSAVTTPQVRLNLDEALAERLYQKLVASGQTKWAAWREPFDESEGLLLEYVHLLTFGERLQETIHSQINQRLRERRDLELEVLRLVATAHAHGAHAPTGALARHLGATGPDLQAAMARLIDEHLLRSTVEGRLAGLHELRSQAIEHERHALPPCSLEATTVELCNLLEGSQMRTFLIRVLPRLTNTRAAADALLARIRAEPNAQLVADVLHALRIVGFGKTAHEWAEIMREEKIAATHAGLLCMFALQRDSSVEAFPGPMQQAVARMRSTSQHDLRHLVLGGIDEPLLDEVLKEAEPTTASSLLAALAHTHVFPKPAALAPVTSNMELPQLRELLSSAYEAAPELAIELVAALGGSEALLQRLENELPWIRGAEVLVEDGGTTIAAADYALVAESTQPDPHGEVVKLCQYLLAYVPGAEFARSRAIDASGDVAGFGIAVAEKKIPRDALPTGAAVAWNRSCGRALTRELSAESLTERLAHERRLLEQAATVVALAGQAYITGHGIRDAVNQAVALAESSEILMSPPEGVEVSGPLDLGNDNVSDSAGYLATMIPHNLIRRLFEGDQQVGLLIPLLIRELDVLGDPDRWTLLTDPPLEALKGLSRDLRNLHTVLSEVRATNGRTGDVLRRAAGRVGTNALARAADCVRRRVRGDLTACRKEIRRTLSNAGYRSWAFHRPGEMESPFWPSEETLVLVQIESAIEWYAYLPSLIELIGSCLRDSPPFFVGLLRGGIMVPSFAVRVINGRSFPVFDELGVWPDMNFPLLVDRASGSFGRCVAALNEASAIIASLRTDDTVDSPGVYIHPAEQDALSAAVERARTGLSEFKTIWSEHEEDPVILEGGEFLVGLSSRVEEEAQDRNNGGLPWQGLATESMAALRGTQSETSQTHAAAVAALIEWDIQPAGVLERLDRAVERIKAAESDAASDY